jgi:hypothetical protein
MAEHLGLMNRIKGDAVAREGKEVKRDIVPKV